MLRGWVIPRGGGSKVDDRESSSLLAQWMRHRPRKLVSVPSEGFQRRHDICMSLDYAASSESESNWTHVRGD